MGQSPKFANFHLIANFNIKLKVLINILHLMTYKNGEFFLVRQSKVGKDFRGTVFGVHSINRIHISLFSKLSTCLRGVIASTLTIMNTYIGMFRLYCIISYTSFWNVYKDIYDLSIISMVCLSEVISGHAVKL